MKVATPASEISPPGSRPSCPEGRRCAQVHVSLSAIVANWGVIARVAGRAEAGVAIKADAYGHGLGPVALALAKAGCRDFFVASIAEGELARDTLGHGPRIWVLNGLEGRNIDRVRAAALRPLINGLEEMASWAGQGAYGLHLDTGMNRLGLPAADWGAAARWPAPELVMSHLACADEPGAPMNALQRARFLQGAALFPHASRSLVASAGMALGPDYLLDLVRPGLALYGHWGAPSVMPSLTPAMSASAPILQIRSVQAGDSVGYGGSYICKKPAVLASVGIGYADGFLRSMSNRGYGALDGIICPIRGRISMDLTVLDITAAGARARPGAMVEIMGPNLSATELALLGDTIAYEVMTSLGSAAAGAKGRVIAW